MTAYKSSGFLQFEAFFVCFDLGNTRNILKGWVCFRNPTSQFENNIIGLIKSVVHGKGVHMYKGVDRFADLSIFFLNIP